MSFSAAAVAFCNASSPPALSTDAFSGGESYTSASTLFTLAAISLGATGCIPGILAPKVAHWPALAAREIICGTATVEIHSSATSAGFLPLTKLSYAVPTAAAVAPMPVANSEDILSPASALWSAVSPRAATAALAAAPAPADAAPLAAATAGAAVPPDAASAAPARVRKPIVEPMVNSALLALASSFSKASHVRRSDLASVANRDAIFTGSFNQSIIVSPLASPYPAAIICPAGDAPMAVPSACPLIISASSLPYCLSSSSVGCLPPPGENAVLTNCQAPAPYLFSYHLPTISLTASVKLPGVVTVFTTSPSGVFTCSEILPSAVGL